MEVYDDVNSKDNCEALFVPQALKEYHMNELLNFFLFLLIYFVYADLPA